MSTKQICSFVTKILPKFKIEIKWVAKTAAEQFFDQYKTTFSLAISRKYDRLYINKKFWKYSSTVIKKALLLHEMGHLYFKSRKIRLSPFEEELVAQLWALQKAQQMPKVKAEILRQLHRWGNQTNWKNRYDRRYVIASRMVSKYGINNLIKKYHINA